LKAAQFKQILGRLKKTTMSCMVGYTNIKNISEGTFQFGTKHFLTDCSKPACGKKNIKIGR